MKVICLLMGASALLVDNALSREEAVPGATYGGGAQPVWGAGPPPDGWYEAGGNDVTPPPGWVKHGSTWYKGIDTSSKSVSAFTEVRAEEGKRRLVRREAAWSGETSEATMQPLWGGGEKPQPCPSDLPDGEWGQMVWGVHPDFPCKRDGEWVKCGYDKEVKSTGPRNVWTGTNPMTGEDYAVFPVKATDGYCHDLVHGNTHYKLPGGREKNTCYCITRGPGAKGSSYDACPGGCDEPGRDGIGEAKQCVCKPEYCFNC